MHPPEKDKIIVRGLAHMASALFMIWGVLAVAKGLWDVFGGQPEANEFSPRAWLFVTQAQWRRYAGFELAYGLACAGVGWALRAYAARLPEWIEREKRISHG